MASANIRLLKEADLRKVLKEKKFVVYDDGRPNIIGIRTANRIAGVYDDVLYVFWSEDGKTVWHSYTITTDPGLKYLKSPIKGSNGAAIVVPGQYVGVWQLGIHREKQRALIQTGGAIKVYRDNNRDDKLDYDPATITEGWYGINFHHGALDDSDTIGGWSAGCQVFRYAEPHQRLIEDFKRLSTKYNFKKFTYTLLKESDFLNK